MKNILTLEYDGKTYIVAYADTKANLLFCNILNKVINELEDMEV